MRHGRQGSSGTTARASSADDPSGCTDGRDGHSPSERNDLPRVAVVGAGAAGTLTAVHLAAEAARRGHPLRLLLVDPAEPGRGVAYSTQDPRHLLNVPAGGLSAYADQPGHFVAWLRREVWHRAGPGDFAPRAEYARYLAATLADAVAAAPDVELERVAHRVVAVEAADHGALLRYDDKTLGRRRRGGPGHRHRGARHRLGTRRATHDEPVHRRPLGARRARRPRRRRGRRGLDRRRTCSVGTGSHDGRPGRDAGPPGRVPARRVPARPRAGGHTTRRQDGGPTPAIDAPRDARRPRRPAPSRRTRPPSAHRCATSSPPPSASAATGAAALDVLRPVTGALWARLRADDRAELLRTDLAWWDLHAHRMPPVTAAGDPPGCAPRAAAGQRRRGARRRAETADGRAVDVTLRSGRRLRVAAVVNGCTGRRATSPGRLTRSTRDLWPAVRRPAGPGPGLRTRGGRLVDVDRVGRRPAVDPRRAAPRSALGDDRDPGDPRTQATALAVSSSEPRPASTPAARRLRTWSRDTPGVSHQKVANGAPGGRRTAQRCDGPAADYAPRGGHRVQPRAGRGDARAVRRRRGVHRGGRARPGLRTRPRRAGDARPRGRRGRRRRRAQLDAATSAVRASGTDRERGLVAVVESRVATAVAPAPTRCSSTSTPTRATCWP